MKGSMRSSGSDLPRGLEIQRFLLWILGFLKAMNLCPKHANKMEFNPLGVVGAYLKRDTVDRAGGRFALQYNVETL